MNNKLIQLITSRKFWAAIVGLALVIIKPYAPDFPLEADQITEPIISMIGVVSIIVTYIFSTAWEDGARFSSQNPPPNNNIPEWDRKSLNAARKNN